MNKNIKTKIARVSILGLFFLLFLVCTLCFSYKSTNAQGYNLGIINYEVLSDTGFDDLPYLPASGSNTLGLDRVCFGYYKYEGSNVFYQIVYSRSTSNVCIVYLSYNDMVHFVNELEDQEYYDYLNSTLPTVIDTVGDILVDSNYRATVPQNYFVNLNYGSYVGYHTYNINSLRVVVDGVSENYDYNQYYGQLNTAYYQQSFYNNIIGYYSDLIDSSVEEASQVSYRIGVEYGQSTSDAVVASKDATIASQADTIAELQQQIATGNTQFASFSNFLQQLFMYPIRFFTEGLNVEVFGINIGDLFLGVFMIILCWGIIKFFAGLII